MKWESAIESINKRLEDRTREFEDRNIEVTQEVVAEGDKRKKKWKSEEIPSDVWDIIKRTNIIWTEGEKRENWAENLFKEIMAKNFPNLERDFDIQFLKLMGHSIISIQNYLFHIHYNETLKN